MDDLEDDEKNDVDLKKVKREFYRRYKEPKKVTHLFLHEKYLKTIPNEKNPSHINYVYLHNNLLTKIENLESLYNITHLHLQWNKITKIEGLSHLYNLKKLYLGNNCISVIENLNMLKNLEELHVEKQNISNSDSLCFDPRTLKDIGGNLKFINVSNNKLIDISWVKYLRRLTVLIAKNNLYDNYEEVADNICVLIYLRKVDFAGNPMAAKHRYKETIVARCPTIDVIDEINIHKNSRDFLCGLEKARQRKQYKPLNKKPSFDSQSVDDLLEFNMGSLNTKSALDLSESRGSKSTAHIIDSSINMVPRCFWRNKVSKSSSRSVASNLPIPSSVVAPTEVKSSTFNNQELDKPSGQAVGVPKRKGILKVPMPMRYI